MIARILRAGSTFSERCFGMADMSQKDLLIWAAGVVEGCGVVVSTVKQGPTRMYHAIDLLVPVSSSEQIRRLTIAAGNGSVHKEPTGFVLGGYAAVRGFIADLWPYFTPAKRSEINMELKRFKLLKAGKL